MDLGFSGEMIFIALLGLILFGPRKLPEIARKVGRLMTDLKRASSEFQEQINREVGEVEVSQPAKALSSLANRIKAINAAANPDKTVMALVEPSQPQQQRGVVSLIDNVDRIKDILATDEAAAKAHDVKQSAQPPELVAGTMSNSGATAEKTLAEAGGSTVTSEFSMPGPAPALAPVVHRPSGPEPGPGQRSQ